MESKVWNLSQKQFETKQKKDQIRKCYDEQVRLLQVELHAKVVRLQMERDRQLDELSFEYARYEDAFRQWKQENYKSESPKQ